MADAPSDWQESDTHLLHELQSLSQSLRHAPTTTDLRRRTPSLSLPPSSAPRSRSRRMSLSPWRSRPNVGDEDREINTLISSTAPEKKGIWNWKPLRALTHIGMQRLSCLFSVEAVSVRHLPPSMNGLRLSVYVRKKETKDGAVRTLPSRVLHCAADFDETLFLRCHVYCASSKQHRLRFEPRPFLIQVAAVDAEELDFGKFSSDLSRLVQESMEKISEGARIRQWDTIFHLAGKAKGGELVLKLGFQIMEDKGVGIFSSKGNDFFSDSNKPSARRQSKSSFSIPSPRHSTRFDTSFAKKELLGMDDWKNLDSDANHPEFEIVDRGIEIRNRGRTPRESEVSSEIVKEIVHDPIQQRRISELDSIAKQIKSLEAMIGNEDLKTDRETAGSRGLDADEQTVTREFLQMLEKEEGKDLESYIPDVLPPSESNGEEEEAEEAESKAFLSDLAKGLGPVIQTRDGGYLAAINPFQIELSRRETPKLAMQISKPLVLPSQKSASGLELFQKLAATGVEELTSEVLSMAAAMDELIGKSAEQIAFEGIAAAIINGRNKEGASSSASSSIAAVKTMAAAMSAGRKQRISTGIWSVTHEEAVRLEEILGFSLQKIEVMAVEALKIEAEMVEEEEEAPNFDVSPLVADGKDPDRLLASAVSLDEWVKNGGCDTRENAVDALLLVVVQLRDPLRCYEAVGGPLIVVIQANAVADGEDSEEVRFKVGSLHVGGLNLKVRRDVGLRGETWDVEKQRLTAMQWLVGHGLGKGAKKGKNVQNKGQEDCIWSFSSRVMADAWLKPVRNPDIKFPKQKC